MLNIKYSKYMMLGMLYFVAINAFFSHYIYWMKEIYEDLELVLKLPKNKRPYIGILFQSEYKASYINQYWVNEFGGQDYKLVIELHPGILSVSLVNKRLMLFYCYEVKRFDAEKLKKFLEAVRGNTVNFGHVLLKNDKHYPARTMTDMKIWVLEITKIEFYHEQSM